VEETFENRCANSVMTYNATIYHALFENVLCDNSGKVIYKDWILHLLNTIIVVI
jgi:hypothetical protein